MARCDSTVGEVGDSCYWPFSFFACSHDGKHVFRCYDGTLRTLGDCPGPKGCHPAMVNYQTQVVCDAPTLVLDAKMPCEVAGAEACGPISRDSTYVCKQAPDLALYWSRADDCTGGAKCRLGADGHATCVP